MTPTLLAVTLWLLWRFIATPATTTAQQLRAMAYSLAPFAALVATAVALLRAPWATKQHLLLQVLASAPKASTEATLELQLACAAPTAPMAKVIYRTEQNPSPDFEGKAEAIAVLHAIFQGVTFNFEVKAEPGEVLTDAVMWSGPAGRHARHVAQCLMDATMRDLARQVVEHPHFRAIFELLFQPPAEGERSIPVTT